MPAQRISRIVDLCEGPDVLDIGCSGGLPDTDPDVASDRWLHGHLRSRFPDCWGIDLLEHRLEKMRRAGHRNLVAADAQRFELAQRFDTIVAGEVIEHLENPGGFLESCRKHLKPGGRIVLTTPYVFGMTSIAYARVKHPVTCSNPEHVMWFCPTTLTQLAERCGLSVDRLELVMDLDIPAGVARRPFFLLLRALRVGQFVLPRRVRSTNILAQLSAA